jgi:hypothetical protein
MSRMEKLGRFLKLSPTLALSDLGKLRNDLRKISKRADFVIQSPEFTAPDGKTPRGRNKAFGLAEFDQKTLCAARIAEAYLFFRRREPGPRNKTAAAAAEALWRATGDRSRNIGEPLNGWRRPFEALKGHSKNVELIRLRTSFRRDLEQAVRRGGPPWFLGTYYPLLPADISATAGAE